jgi:hypothetical protein
MCGAMGRFTRAGPQRICYNFRMRKTATPHLDRIARQAAALTHNKVPGPLLVEIGDIRMSIGSIVKERHPAIRAALEIIVSAALKRA